MSSEPTRPWWDCSRCAICDDPIDDDLMFCPSCWDFPDKEDDAFGVAEGQPHGE